ncbi:hypothetical protein [Nocardia sp. NPDC004260]
MVWIGRRRLAGIDISLPEVSKSFLVAKRAPEPRLWTVSNGDIEDRTTIGTAWIGDRQAFRYFSGLYHDELAQVTKNKEARLIWAMQSVVGMDQIETVGGYMVRVTGDRSNPFRFFGDPMGTGPWLTNALLSRSGDGKASLAITVPPGGDPTQHWRIPIPGVAPTFSALAQFIPEIGKAWLHTHEEPWSDPILVAATSVEELIETARETHQQFLKMPDAPFLQDLLGIER